MSGSTDLKQKEMDKFNIQSFFGNRLVAKFIWILIVVIGAVFLFYSLSAFYYVNFKLIDSDSISDSLPYPLFDRHIPVKYMNHWRSISIYDSKEKGKSIFGKLLALKRDKQNKPVIYASLKENPCVDLGIAAGIYPKHGSFAEFILFITLWTGFPKSFDVTSCDVADILKQIGVAASSLVLLLIVCFI